MVLEGILVDLLEDEFGVPLSTLEGGDACFLSFGDFFSTANVLPPPNDFLVSSSCSSVWTEERKNDMHWGRVIHSVEQEI